MWACPGSCCRTQAVDSSSLRIFELLQPQEWLAGLLPTSIGVQPAFLGILATLHHEGVGLYQGVGVILLPSLCTSAPAAHAMEAF